MVILFLNDRQTQTPQRRNRVNGPTVDDVAGVHGAIGFLSSIFAVSRP